MTGEPLVGEGWSGTLAGLWGLPQEVTSKPRQPANQARTKAFMYAAYQLSLVENLSNSEELSESFAPSVELC